MSSAERTRRRGAKQPECARLFVSFSLSPVLRDLLLLDLPLGVMLLLHDLPFDFLLLLRLGEELGELNELGDREGERPRRLPFLGAFRGGLLGLPASNIFSACAK